MKFYPIACLVLISVFSTHYVMCGGVTSVTGDTGSAQSGALGLSGGTSGAAFDSSTSTLMQSFNFLSMPNSTSTDGQILFGGNAVFHCYNAITNLFVGDSSGNFTLTGVQNTGCGATTLAALTSGEFNTACGSAGLANLTTGLGNITVGYQAGNSIIDGQYNIIVGTQAGNNYTGSESNNIILGTNPGTPGESNVIRIGGGGQQTACFVDGIYGASVDFNSGLPVYVDQQGTLGTVLSSIRFKDKIKPIGNDSAPILQFNPVEYVLKADKSKTKQFGLIAEDVFKLMPDLVVLDKHGEPYAVRYNELPVLILNEMQKLENRVAKLEAKMARMMEYTEQLEARLCDK